MTPIAYSYSISGSIALGWMMYTDRIVLEEVPIVSRSST